MLTNNTLQHKCAVSANHGTKARNGNYFGLSQRGSNSTSKNWDLIWEAATRLGFPEREKKIINLCQWSWLYEYAKALGMDTYQKKRVEVEAWVKETEKTIAQLAEAEVEAWVEKTKTIAQLAKKNISKPESTETRIEDVPVSSFAVDELEVLLEVFASSLSKDFETVLTQYAELSCFQKEYCFLDSLFPCDPDKSYAFSRSEQLGLISEITTLLQKLETNPNGLKYPETLVLDSDFEWRDLTDKEINDIWATFSEEESEAISDYGAEVAAGEMSTSDAVKAILMG